MKKDSPIYNKKPDPKVLTQVTDWFDKVKSQELTPDEKTRFFSWLAEDPIHQEEFDFMSTLWDCTDVLAEEPLPAPEVQENKSKLRVGFFQRWYDTVNTSIPMFKPMAGIAVAMLIVAVVWMLQSNGSSRQIFKTATGEQRTVYLKDGSSICLDSETIVTTDYTMDSRRIDLNKGRASFSVQHDPKRPFIVSVGDVFVRAVGTKFSVFKRKKGNVAIAVTEGQVKVTQEDPMLLEETQPEKEILVTTKKIITPSVEKTPEPLQQILNPGQKILVEKTRKVYKVKQVETRHIAGWENGRLFFRKTPLEDVIEEINRYLEKKIVIGDARLNSHRISIIFKIRDRKYFLKTLKTAIPIISKASSKGHIIISKKEEPFISG